MLLAERNGELRRMYVALEKRFAAVEALVREQAEDPGLWFRAETVTESYLQTAIRHLHAVIEGEDFKPRQVPPATTKDPN